MKNGVELASDEGGKTNNELTLYTQGFKKLKTNKT